MIEKNSKIFEDWINGLYQYKSWSIFAFNDIKIRYKRSTLGPLWIVIAMLVTILAIGPLYSIIFKIPINEYILYLAVGLVVWTLISNTLTDSSDIFINSEKTMKQIKLPYSFYIYKFIFKNLIIFTHYFIAISVICVFFPPKSYDNIILLPISILVLFLNLTWMSSIISLTAARFRDVNQLIANFMQLSFFLTPVIWKIENLKYGYLINYNIFYHLINIIRGPIVGEGAFINSLLVTFISLIIGNSFAIFLYSKYKDKIIYWI
jgi:lipopolysaccharide transport system permease protein